MYEKILVPLDGSRRAEAILPYVIELALRQGSKLVLLNVVEPKLSTINPYTAPLVLDTEAYTNQTEIAEGYLTGLARNLDDRGIKVGTLVEHGPTVGTVIGVAARENADLIAIASHGRSGLARAFYGSVAAGLLNQIDRPLLLIRATDEQS